LTQVLLREQGKPTTAPATEARPAERPNVSDSAWLAQLGECGLLEASFVPPEPVRQLRDLTRYRSTLTLERTREAQRLRKGLNLASDFFTNHNPERGIQPIIGQANDLGLTVCLHPIPDVA
jgi:hypothetical protein